jgi:SPP1 family predicted phage head-tail adaptor
MLGAGALRHRVSFQRRQTTDDGFGNVQFTWADHWKCWAGVKPEYGRETLEAGRMESTMRGVVTVLSCQKARDVKNGDRVTFLTGPYSGQSAQIRSIVPTPLGGEIEMVIETGVAT